MSFYVNHYLRLRNATFALMCHGVRFDREGADVKARELGARKDAIKGELDAITRIWDMEKQRWDQYHIYATTRHRSPKLIKLLDQKRKLVEAKDAIPKELKGERKPLIARAKEVALEIKQCRTDGSDSVVEIGTGLSDQKIIHFIYEKLNCTPHFKKGADGKKVRTCDDVALKKVAQERSELEGLVGLILEHRKCNKQLGYLGEKICDADGRVRSMYKPFGTQTGRLSSSSNPMGTGTNAQNFDSALKYLLIPDAG